MISGVTRGLCWGAKLSLTGPTSQHSEKKLENDSESVCCGYLYYLKQTENTRKNAKNSLTEN